MENMLSFKEYIDANRLKYYIKTYGCQMNDHESEKISGLLESIGYKPSNTPEGADIIIFNTCCIRENAEQKTFGNIGALKKLKEDNHDTIIAVCGCMTQQEESAKKLFEMFPFVNIVIGTHNLYLLPQMVEQCLLEGKRVFAVAQDSGEVHERIPVIRGARPLASVNIMYGCNNFCSYCIVPYVRGRERSRDTANILDEINGLAGNGYKEVMLLGQNVNSYHGTDGTDFPALLRRICRDTDISRIRFMTSHPKDLSGRLIRVIADNKKVCKHVHLPVQAGSDAVLRRMNRGYTRERYLELVSAIRDAAPAVTLTTDIIAGFPGESEADFMDTMSLLETVRFDSAFTFVYSRRRGTKAASMPGEVDETVKRDRIIRLIDLQNRIGEEEIKKYEGTVQQVLVEGISTRDRGHVCGRTDGGKMVNFLGDRSLIGDFRNVKIVQAKRTTLFGELRKTGEKG
jgi:tRNA-2-methylthio-N6-dimethylallyladenosine synthase